MKLFKENDVVGLDGDPLLRHLVWGTLDRGRVATWCGRGSTVVAMRVNGPNCVACIAKADFARRDDLRIAEQRRGQDVTARTSSRRLAKR